MIELYAIFVISIFALFVLCVLFKYLHDKFVTKKGEKHLENANELLEIYQRVVQERKAHIDSKCRRAESRAERPASRQLDRRISED